MWTRPKRDGELLKEDIRKILVIKLRAIGDVVLSTAVLPNLKKAFQSAEVHFLVEHPARQVVEGNPYIDRVIVLPKKGRKTAAFGEWLRFFKTLRREKYDLVLDLFGNPRSAFLSLMTGASCRVGFSFRGRRYAYHTCVRPRGDRVHEVDFNLDALRALNIPIVDDSPLFPVFEKDRSAIDAWIEEKGLGDSFLVGMHPWGSWEAKRWGIEKYAALADRFVEDFHAEVVVLWGPGEKAHAERVKDLARHALTLAPRTTLKELGALCLRCRFVVANDSGPMHISAAVGTPTVGIFGPTNSRLQGPYGSLHHVVEKKGLDCLGCNRLVCETNACMKDLSVEEVWQALRPLLEEDESVSNQRMAVR